MLCNPLIAGDGFTNSLIISNDEYANLIEAKTQLELILSTAGADGYGSSDIIKAIKKSRETVITAVKPQE